MVNNQLAPGELEIVRSFLNTWEIPNDTRKPTEHLISVEDVKNFIFNHFSNVNFSGELKEIHQFRKDIRVCVETNTVDNLTKWLTSYPLKLSILDVDNIQYDSIEKHNFFSEILIIIVNNIALKQWKRLKACPDCKWVFYDNSRNGTKRWCGMYASKSKGRSCGTIAKVQRHRRKHKIN
ncbi:CGNR zinc finger domain-containing protein [Bacillus sp. XF8]|uniref:CGNR zinc finger domain-containing protein n=1 Tax=Bacillus sp. XF8 TaxID=2819289 RepID=UPI001AA01CE9|nr:CGNR zinc finger domain-containing protein [Bacillus sp. XF8]MBO1582104.1 CGNR zinc finger domain-containing protein [Bacillus sp. XF8]